MKLQSITPRYVMRWPIPHELVVCRLKGELLLTSNDLVKLRFSNGVVHHVDGSISPNRQWLLWTEGDSGLASLTTHKVMSRKCVLPHTMKKYVRDKSDATSHWGNGCWSRDSDHWIRVFLQYGDLLFAKQSLTNAEEISGGNLSVPPGANRTWDGSYCELLGADSSGRIIASTTLEPGKANLFSFAAVAGKENVIPFIVNFPDGLVPRYCALSASGDEIAWIVYHDVKRLEDNVPLRSIFVFASDSRGNNMRALTSLEGTSKADVHFGSVYSPEEEPCYLTWFDQDKHVSFFFRGKTWALQSK